MEKDEERRGEKPKKKNREVGKGRKGENGIVWATPTKKNHSRDEKGREPGVFKKRHGRPPDFSTVRREGGGSCTGKPRGEGIRGP